MSSKAPRTPEDVEGPAVSLRDLQAVLREDFLSFLQKVFQQLCPGDCFQFNWHLEAIAWQLEQIRNGDLRRLIITMPPRHLKSIAISIAWVAYELGRHPETRFICLSYNTELSAKFSRDCRDVMQSDWYRALFPNTVLSRATETELETTLGGGRFATSVGGTLTGRGADVIIVDDPTKADAANSPAERRSAIEWTTSTLFSRLNDKQTGAIVLVMQRLHEEDLAGYLLTSGDWEHLNLPAIAEEEQTVPIGPDQLHHRKVGDVLHPEREPLETLMEIQRELGSHVFSAQYQQAPIPMGGTLVRQDWLRHQDTPPVKSASDQIVQSWDTASKDGVLSLARSAHFLFRPGLARSERSARFLGVGVSPHRPLGEVQGDPNFCNSNSLFFCRLARSCRPPEDSSNVGNPPPSGRYPQRQGS